jgi:hypothetical protein
MKTHRCAILAALMLLPIVAAFAQKTPGKRAAVGGSSAPLPRTSPAIKTKGAVAHTSGPRPRGGGSSITQLGSVVTASPGESFALSGNIAYVCDDNEVSVVDIMNPQAPQIVATALSGLFQQASDTHCALLRGALSVFSDQSSTVGDTPGYSAFDLTNPLQPQLIAATPINKRFFQAPVYIGNLAFVPTDSLEFFLGFQWDAEFGDLLAVDLTNFSNPVLDGTAEQPQVDPVYGGPTVVLGATEADTNLLYLGGSTSTGGANNGVGRLQIVDVTNPAAMQISGQLLIPGTSLFYAPLIEGTVAVGIGNTGGFVGSLNANPFTQGNIVVATFDATDRRSPAILSITTTTYSVGYGGGSTQIGPTLFAFAGVQDSGGNQVLLIVDVTNPSAPVFSSYPITQSFTSMQAVGTTLYATLGSGGFGIFSIPGISTGQPSVCPVSIDTLLVIDRGANIQSQAFAATNAALQSFLGSLQFPPDQAGVVTFTNTAVLDQTLTTNESQVQTVLAGILPAAPSSYIGSGIATAQRELLGPRHSLSANPVMIVISDGADLGAPSSGATLAAATAAKAAGIEIISVQYGATASPLTQSIASSSSNFYLVSP